MPIAVLPLLLCMLLTLDAKAQNFVIRGTVTCVTPRGTFELAGAEVEIFRYRWWWSDDRVAVTSTDKGGMYRVSVQADDAGEYYARVRLTDGQHVYLEEAVNSSTWSQDSPRESNDRAEIIADFELKKDDGGGTPECEIWAGVKTAYEEYQTTIGGDPPETNYKVLLWKTIQVPYSFLATINWPENYSPGFSSGDPFERFRTSFHEFGHTVRHSLDGDWNHLVNDASAFTYVQFHDFCEHPIGIGPTGFAFNEGWADFWSNVGRSCLGEEDNFDLEGNVARDLLALAKCPGVGRKGMVSILMQGQNIIHSQDEFRDRFQATFPTCPLPPRDGSGTPTSHPLSLPPPIEPAQLRAAIERDIATIDAARKSLESKLTTLLTAPCAGSRGIDRDLRAEVARARIATAWFTLGLLRQDLATVERGQTLSDYSFGARDVWDIRAQRTTAAHRDIVLTALKRIESLLKQRGDSAEAKRVARQMQVIESGTLQDPTLLKLADVRNLQSNDLDLPTAPSGPPWWHGWLIVLGVLFFVAIVLLLIMRRHTPDQHA